MHFGLKYYRSFWNYAAERDTDTVPFYVTDITLDPATATLRITPQALGVASQTLALSTATLHLSSVSGAAVSTIRDAETWLGSLDDSTSQNTKLADTAYQGKVRATAWRGKLDDDV